MLRLAILIVVVSHGWAPRAFAEPTDVESSDGASEPEWFVDLVARRDAARARLDAAGWENAFAELADLSFGDPSALRIRLATLSARGVARAAERTAPAPVGLTPEEIAAWRAAVVETTDLEDRADAAEARFVSGLLAGLERAPGLTDGSVERWEATLPQPPDDPHAPIPADVRAAADEARTLQAWRRAAWVAMTVPGDPRLADLVARELATPPVAPSDADPILRLRSEAMRDRLRRVAPLLDRSLATTVYAWLGEAEPLAEREVLDRTEAAPVVAVEAPAPPAPVTVSPPSPPVAAEDAAAMARVATWRQELDRLHAAHAEAEQRTSLDRQRQPQRDATYLAVRELVAQLHEAVIRSPAPTATEAGYQTVGLLFEAKKLRREARFVASSAVTEASRRAFIPELLQELNDIPAVWSYNTERFVRRIQSIPVLLLDVTAVYGFAARLTLFVVVFVSWWFLRSWVPRWLGAWIDGLADPSARGGQGRSVTASVSWWLENSIDIRRLAPLVSRLGRRLVDLLGACALLVWTREDTPVIELLATLLAALALWRVRPLVVDLLFATVEDQRPAFFVVDEVRLRRLRALVAAFVAWWLVWVCIGVLLLDVLAAFKWRQLTDTLGAAVGIVLTLAALWMEEPYIRASLAQLQPTPFVRSVASPSNPWTRLPKATAGLVLLVTFHASRMIAELAATSRRLRWVGTVLARRQLAQSTQLRPLDPEIAARIARLDHGVAPKVRAAVDRVVATHGRWKTERSGMVALVAERGAGLALVPDMLAAALEDVRLLKVPRRISDEQEGRAWLAEALGVPNTDAGFVPAVQAQAPSSFVVSDAHLLFLRRAGGFAAVRWMLGVMQETSEEHFWVWCTDAQTWAYLNETPGAVDLGVFQEEIHVEPMLPDEIGSWLLDPLTLVGLRPSFLSLARGGGADGVDPRAEQRARRAYFRVLDDLSQGRPVIARSLWQASLRSGDNGAIEHAIPTLPDGIAGVDALRDEDLFVLTALVVHAGLDVESLSQVLNRPPMRVQSTCRRLEARGVLIGDEQGSWFDVPEVVHPSVVRVLRQRAFLDAR